MTLEDGHKQLTNCPRPDPGNQEIDQVSKPSLNVEYSKIEKENRCLLCGYQDTIYDFRDEKRLSPGYHCSGLVGKDPFLVSTNIAIYHT